MGYVQALMINTETNISFSVGNDDWDDLGLQIALFNTTCTSFSKITTNIMTSKSKVQKDIFSEI